MKVCKDKYEFLLGFKFIKKDQWYFALEFFDLLEFFNIPYKHIKLRRWQYTTKLETNDFFPISQTFSSNTYAMDKVDNLYKFCKCQGYDYSEWVKSNPVFRITKELEKLKHQKKS